ncbi:CHAT domain-containing protein [Glycomyces luteolus]|uniref:CHAT domain-containing protein n=1 Tax=Glycomyces luteolus TaxID=2670330 RepID=A0A9X3P9Q9_9ACTN|nr:CHAT domain-containing protein [Glycomyces luteolus]MDA1359528.1 CHAT domain-containing protein [Glycomyces luteolus]
MRGRDELLEMLHQSLAWIESSQDPSMAWSPGVMALAEHLRASLVETQASDIHARLALGWLTWYQVLAAPSAAVRDAKTAEALDLLADPAVAGFGHLDLPEALLPALADRSVARMLDLLNYAAAQADAQLFSDLVDQWLFLTSVTPQTHPERARRLAWCCGMLVVRHQRTGAAADIERAVAVGKLAVELGSGDHDLGIHLSNLSAAHKTRYDLHHEPADLDEAIATARRAVAITPGPAVLAPATNLCGVLILRYKRDGDDADVTEAVRIGRIAAAHAQSDAPDRELALYNFANALYFQYQSTGSPPVLLEAVQVAKEAVRTGEGRPDAGMRLELLADVLQERSTLNRSVADLDSAILAARRVIELSATPKPEHSHRLAGLLFDRASRFMADTTIEDLDELVAVSRRSAASPTEAFVITSLSIALLARFSKSDAEADLDEAVEVARRGAAFDPATRGGGRGALQQLDQALWARWEHRGETRDLDELIATRTKIVEATPAADPALSERRSRLAQSLFTRYATTDAAADLEAAVSALREALAAASDGTGRLVHRTDLSCVLHALYSLRHSRSDLAEAADHARAAAAEAPAASASSLLYNLAVVLHDWARKSGDLGDLDLAISLAKRALAAHDQPGEAIRGHFLASRTRTGQLPSTRLGPDDLHVMIEDYLAHRFEWTNAKADADTLVRLRREAADRWGGEGRAGAGGPEALAAALKLRFLLTYDPADIDEAVVHYRAALEREPESAGRMVPLSDALRHRANATQEESDLEEALELARRAVRLGPWSHAYGNLAMVLLDRFKAERYLYEELDEAVDAARQAVDADPEGVDRPKWLFTLGEVLLMRVQRPNRLPGSRGDEGREEDRKEALRVLAELVRMPVAPPQYRVQAAKRVGWLAVNAVETAREFEDYEPEDLALAADVLAVAVGLLTDVAPRRMGRGEQQQAMASMAGVAGDAAMLALVDPSRPTKERARRALALLEQGRAVLLGRVLDTRGGLAELRAADPALAERFTMLRDALDRDPDATVPADDDRIDTAAGLEALLREIRRLDGFADFAMPPDVDDLFAVAAQGPIVCFNLASGGTALLISTEDVSALDLPGVNAATVTDQANEFHVALREAHDPAGDRIRAQQTLTDVLKWLWDNVTGPVLDALGIDGTAPGDAPLPRIWWAPGGYLGLLPLHAAGHHDQPGSGMTVLDRAVSSYTPTVKALRHARSRQATGGARGSLIVPMPTTPGMSDLRHVPEETEMLAELLPEALVVDEPDRDRVLAALPGRSIAHFACHGSFDLNDPAASRLVLHDYKDRPLTVAQLASIDFEGAALAFLSACHTALNATERLLEEGMHLAAAMQAAGFPQVVATLWEVDDEIAVEIAEDFYTDMIDPRTGRPETARAARSLHRAVRLQRDRYPATPSLWASHLHFGA